MPITSAGILMYRLHEGGPQVLLAHPGGPFWRRWPPSRAMAARASVTVVAGGNVAPAGVALIETLNSGTYRKFAIAIRRSRRNLRHETAVAARAGEDQRATPAALRRR